MKLKHALMVNFSWLLAFVAPVGGAFVYYKNLTAETPWFWIKYGMEAHYPAIEAIMSVALLGLAVLILVLGMLRHHIVRDSGRCDSCARYDRKMNRHQKAILERTNEDTIEESA